MPNVANIISLTGRLAKDPVFYENKDGSKKACTTIAIERFKLNDKCQFIHVEELLSADVGEGPWENLRKGCRVQLLGHLKSEAYQKDGKTVSRVIVIVDSVNYLDTIVQTAAHRSANAVAVAAAERTG